MKVIPPSPIWDVRTAEDRMSTIYDGSWTCHCAEIFFSSPPCVCVCVGVGVGVGGGGEGAGVILIKRANKISSDSAFHIRKTYGRIES